MSDRPIQVGDLVVIVKPRRCCGNGDTIGTIFTVRSFAKKCKCACGASYEGKFAVMENGWWRCETFRLKRIPPLDELESEKRDEEITA